VSTTLAADELNTAAVPVPTVVMVSSFLQANNTVLASKKTSNLLNSVFILIIF
jgi:hypothetical protein